MPNHILTNFSVTGPISDVERFIKDAAHSEHDSVMSLDSLFPMPGELRMVSSPVRIMTQTEIDKMWDDWRIKKASKEDSGPMGIHSFNSDKPFGLGITKETSDSYKAKYGFDNWYDWAMYNWGSKWGVYDVGGWHLNKENDVATATTNYSTAWSPVTEAWLKISENYPSLVFFHEFADEGGNFVGNQYIQNGKIIEDNDYEWESDEGIVIREGVGLYVEEDEV